MNIETIAKNAKTASLKLQNLSTEVKNKVLKNITAELENIAQAGFTAVQTSPAQASGGKGQWYWLYQPLGFSVQTNELGSKMDLQNLCTEADKYGIKVIVDVVANHLAGDHENIQQDLAADEDFYTETFF